VQIVECLREPTVPEGWRVAPLQGRPSWRWLTWDDAAAQVVVVRSTAPPELCASLWSCEYLLVGAARTYEVWAALRTGS